MASVIQSAAAKFEVRRNRFKEPWPSTPAMFQVSRMSVSFTGAGTRVAVARGVLTEAGSGYFNLTTPANRIAVTPGEVVGYSAETMGSAGVARRLRLYFITSTGSILPTSTDSAPESVAEWRVQTVSAPAPANAVFAGAYLLMPSDAPLGSELQIRKVNGGAVGAFIDGSMNASGNLSYTWAGKVNESESIAWRSLPTVDVRPLIVSNIELSRTPGTIVHDLLASDRRDVTFRPGGLRSGTLTLVMPDLASCAAAFNALMTPVPMQFVDADVPELGMWFAVASNDVTMRIDPVTRKRWLLGVPFEEVVP